MTAEEIIALLGLDPHPAEGGYFIETYRSGEQSSQAALPDRYGGPRSFGTAIYYLLTADTFSALHRLKSDEIFHFYVGDPVEMLRLHPNGSGETLVIGPDLAKGQRPQVLVPMGVWQGSRLVEGGRFALLGCTVAPGFDFSDYEHGEEKTLAAEYPAHGAAIKRLI